MLLPCALDCPELENIVTFEDPVEVDPDDGGGGGDDVDVDVVAAAAASAASNSSRFFCAPSICCSFFVKLI